MGRKEILVSEQALQVPYKYAAGKTASRFFAALRDEAAIYGVKCPKCKKVLVPPRATCGACFKETREWVKLSGKGKIESFTELKYSETSHPVKAPFTLGIIKLDGADTGMLHLVKGAKGKKPRIGARVKAVFAQQRKGHILDISHFEIT